MPAADSSAVQDKETGGSRGKAFFPIDLATMQPGTRTPADLYLQEKHPPGFILYKNANKPLTDKVRERLLSHGIEQLYMRKEDEEAFYEYVTEQIDAILADDLLSPEKAMPVIYQCGAWVMNKVLEEPRSGANLKQATDMVEPMVDTVLRSEQPVEELTSLIAHDYYTYTHCVNVCVFLLATAKAILGIQNESTLRDIGRGAILHDIGKSQIPEEILTKPSALTPDEFEEIKKHPVLGLEMARKHLKLSGLTAALIRNHHEQHDGGGYPDGLKGDAIPPVVRLAKIIDVYDALTTKRCYADKSAPYDALAIMVQKMEGHFSLPELRAFIKYLGPREPSRDSRAKQ